MKIEIVKQHIEGVQLESRSEIIQYPEFKVFGIYRDPTDRLFSVFKDFIRSGKEMRLTQMESLFNREVSTLSFSEFLDLAMVYKDHHWNPNFTYLFLSDVHVTLFNYHKNVIEEVEDFLGLEVTKYVENPSSLYEHNITFEEEEKIHQIMKLDYENMNYFKERIVNA